MLRRALSGLFTACILLAIMAFAAVPGPHRAAAPGLFGLPNPAPRLYTDAPERTGEFLAMIAEAEAVTEAFFGTLDRDPLWVVCTTGACQQEFGFGSNGVALGAHFVLIGPNGLRQVTFTHERIHIALHKYLGLSDILHPRFPAWFDEGLASHLSGDTRLTPYPNARDADWIRTARRLSDWNALQQGASWRDRYGAAARLVAEVEEIGGQDGLRRLVEAVGAGADFETEYEALLQSAR